MTTEKIKRNPQKVVVIDGRTFHINAVAYMDFGAKISYYAVEIKTRWKFFKFEYLLPKYAYKTDQDLEISVSKVEQHIEEYVEKQRWRREQLDEVDRLNYLLNP